MATTSHEGEGDTAGRTEPGGVAPAISPGRQAFRLLVGLATVGPERLAAGLRLLADVRGVTPLPVDSASGALPPGTPASPRHVLIGALSQLPAVAQEFLAGARAHVDPPARRWGARAAQVLPRVVPERLVQGPLRDLRAQLAQHAAQLAVVGRREEQAGRQLFEIGAQVIPDTILSAVAESPDLRRVMSEQTAGLTRTAVTRLRETSARADDVGESLARRFFRRRKS